MKTQLQWHENIPVNLISSEDQMKPPRRFSSPESWCPLWIIQVVAPCVRLMQMTIVSRWNLFFSRVFWSSRALPCCVDIPRCSFLRHLRLATLRTRKMRKGYLVCTSSAEVDFVAPRRRRWAPWGDLATDHSCQLSSDPLPPTLWKVWGFSP